MPEYCEKCGAMEFTTISIGYSEAVYACKDCGQMVSVRRNDTILMQELQAA